MRWFLKTVKNWVKTRKPFADRCTLSWKAIPRRIYRAQFKNDLWDAEWNDIPGDIVSESDLGSAVAPADAEQRFYRVVLVEQP